MRKRVTFILNPISGTEDKRSIGLLVERYLHTSTYDWEIIHTEYAGHATDIAKEKASNGVDIVAAIGGDGTVNEVARALVHTDTTLAIIPCGSGNGLARHLKIPLDTKDALSVFNHGVVDTIDYGTANGLPFFCTCGIGFDAFVSLKFAEANKRGMLTYVEKALHEGLRYKPRLYEVCVDGVCADIEAYLITCGNASQYGNNAYITPLASVKDGFMDVTALEQMNLIEIPQVAFLLFNGNINKHSKVKTFKCKELKIKCVEETDIHFDGDPMGKVTELKIKAIEKGLHVLVPKKLKR